MPEVAKLSDRSKSSKSSQSLEDEEDTDSVNDLQNTTKSYTTFMRTMSFHIKAKRKASTKTMDLQLKT